MRQRGIISFQLTCSVERELLEVGLQCQVIVSGHYICWQDFSILGYVNAAGDVCHGSTHVAVGAMAVLGGLQDNFCSCGFCGFGSFRQGPQPLWETDESTFCVRKAPLPSRMRLKSAKTRSECTQSSLT